jgi:oligopeptide transport system substrate-binding protein
LETAGFPDGANFREIRLVVNRNDTQQRVAKAVAGMWKQHLNLETKIIVKEAEEIEKIRSSGEYDLLRRGAVMPTADESVSLNSIFGVPDELGGRATASLNSNATGRPTPTPGILTNPGGPAVSLIDGAESLPFADIEPLAEPTVSEDNAMFRLYAIPLYFPISYALVRPYVRGFAANGLDAPSLHEVSLDENWQPISR